MEFFESFTAGDDSDGDGPRFIQSQSHRFSAEKQMQIMREYVNNRYNGGDGKEVFEKYELTEHEIVALATTARIIAIMSAWDAGEGKPTKKLVDVLVETFEDSGSVDDGSSTMSLMVTLSYYAWQYVQYMQGKQSED